MEYTEAMGKTFKVTAQSALNGCTGVMYKAQSVVSSKLSIYFLDFGQDIQSVFIENEISPALYDYPLTFGKEKLHIPLHFPR